MRFTIESCWPVTVQELLNLSIRIVHSGDIDQFVQTISKTSSQVCYGIINMRVHLLHAKYRNINLWYSSSGAASQNVARISVLINLLSADHSVLMKQILSCIKLRRNDHHLLQLCFNTSTEQSLKTVYDVNIEYFPRMSYRRTLEAVQNLLLYHDDKPCIQMGIDRFDRIKANNVDYDYYYCDIRLYTDADRTSDSETACRWYRFEQEIVKNDQTDCSVVVISFFDIHKFKLAKLQRAALQVLDPDTDLLSFDSFFHQYVLAVNNIKRSAQQQQTLVILIIEFQLEATSDTSSRIYNEAIQAISRNIRAMTRKEDLIGRYSKDRITILLRESEHNEYLSDRIRLLDHFIHLAASENNAKYRIGYHISDYHNDITTVQGLEKAQMPLFWTRIPGQSHILSYSQNTHDLIANEVFSYVNNKENDPVAIKNVEIRTFGAFSVFVNGDAIPFVNQKAKELLAVLITKNGSFVTPGQLISCLWEDEPCNKKTLSRLRKTMLLLKRELEKHDLQDLIESVNGNRRFVTADWITCDYFDFLAGKLRNIRNPGIYMPEYSWAEETNAMLENRFFKPQSSRIVNESKRNIRFAASTARMASAAKQQDAQLPSAQN